MRLQNSFCPGVREKRRRVLFNLLINKIAPVSALICCIFTAGIAPVQAKTLNCSLASHYGVGDGYHGLTTANGERYNAYGLSAAHKKYPFGTRLLVTNQDNGKQVIVRVNDRGPFIPGREIDLSYGAFSTIASPSQGIAKVCIAKI